MTVVEDFYCPSCGYECTVAFDGERGLETCECADCGGVMLKDEEVWGP